MKGEDLWITNINSAKTSEKMKMFRENSSEAILFYNQIYELLLKCGEVLFDKQFQISTFSENMTTSTSVVNSVNCDHINISSNKWNQMEGGWKFEYSVMFLTKYPISWSNFIAIFTQKYNFFKGSTALTLEVISMGGYILSPIITATITYIPHYYLSS